jgi:hypothetical protein
MKYRIEPVQGAGFMIVEQSGVPKVEDLERIKVVGTIAFAGEVIVTAAAGREADDQPAVNGRIAVGHGLRSSEVIEAEFVLEEW